MAGLCLLLKPADCGGSVHARLLLLSMLGTGGLAVPCDAQISAARVVGRRRGRCGHPTHGLPLCGRGALLPLLGPHLLPSLAGRCLGLHAVRARLIPAAALPLPPEAAPGTWFLFASVLPLPLTVSPFRPWIAFRGEVPARRAGAETVIPVNHRLLDQV